MLESHIEIFELCIAMMTALLGLAYPLFIERISNIDGRYKSRRISQKFKCEYSYVFFNTLIVICIILLFTVPFIIAALNSNVWNQILITIQGLFVFVLSMTMVRLYHLILTYNDPEQLFNRIRANETEEERFEDLQILAELAASDETLVDLYNSCMEELAIHVFSFQQNELNLYGNEEE